MAPPKPAKRPKAFPKPAKRPKAPPKPVKRPKAPPKPAKRPKAPPKPVKRPKAPPKPAKRPKPPPKPPKAPPKSPKRPPVKGPSENYKRLAWDELLENAYTTSHAMNGRVIAFFPDAEARLPASSDETYSRAIVLDYEDAMNHPEAWWIWIRVGVSVYPGTKDKQHKYLRKRGKWQTFSGAYRLSPKPHDLGGIEISNREEDSPSVAFASAREIIHRMIDKGYEIEAILVRYYYRADGSRPEYK